MGKSKNINELKAEIKRITNYDGIGCGTTLFEGHYKCRAGSLCPICEKKAEKDGIIDIAVSLIGKACSKHTEMVKKMGFQEFMEKHPPECLWCLKSEKERLEKELKKAANHMDIEYYDVAGGKGIKEIRTYMSMNWHHAEVKAEVNKALTAITEKVE